MEKLIAAFDVSLLIYLLSYGLTMFVRLMFFVDLFMINCIVEVRVVPTNPEARFCK